MSTIHLEIRKYHLPFAGIILTLLILMASFSLLVFLYGSGVSAQTQGIVSLIESSRAKKIFLVASQQALLSCIVSFILAVPISSVLARRYHWPVVPFLFNILGLVLVMPTTVAAVGILKVWGINGWLSDVMAVITFGKLNWINIYGMDGVVLAHVFFNLPLMIRVLTPIFLSFSQEHLFLSNQFGFNRIQHFKVLEWPAIKRAAISVNLLVFLLCFTSFSLVLMLGGGPAVTTFEVEIYSALRFDFNISKAAALGLIQVSFVVLLIFLLTFASNGDQKKSQFYLPLSNRSHEEIITTKASKDALNAYYTLRFLVDTLWLSVLFFIVFLPLSSVILAGLSESLASVLKWEIFWTSFKNTISISLISALLALGLGLLLAHSKVMLRYHNLVGRRFFLSLIESSILIYLAIPAIVLGTGLFLVFRKFVDIMAISWLIIIISNVFLCLPFVVGIIEPRLLSLEAKYERISKSLDITGVRKFFDITAPGLGMELGLALGLSLSFSIGDLSIIALFGNNDFQTIPWLIYQTFGRYGLSDANALSLILLIITFFFFFFSQILVRKMCTLLARRVG